MCSPPITPETILCVGALHAFTAPPHTTTTTAATAPPEAFAQAPRRMVDDPPPKTPNLDIWYQQGLFDRGGHYLTHNPTLPLGAAVLGDIRRLLGWLADRVHKHEHCEFTLRQFIYTREALDTMRAILKGMDTQLWQRRSPDERGMYSQPWEWRQIEETDNAFDRVVDSIQRSYNINVYGRGALRINFRRSLKFPYFTR